MNCDIYIIIYIIIYIYIHPETSTLANSDVICGNLWIKSAATPVFKRRFHRGDIGIQMHGPLGFP